MLEAISALWSPDPESVSASSSVSGGPESLSSSSSGSAFPSPPAPGTAGGGGAGGNGWRLGAGGGGVFASAAAVTDPLAGVPINRLASFLPSPMDRRGSLGLGGNSVQGLVVEGPVRVRGQFPVAVLAALAEMRL